MTGAWSQLPPHAVLAACLRQPYTEVVVHGVILETPSDTAHPPHLLESIVGGLKVKVLRGVGGVVDQHVVAAPLDQLSCVNGCAAILRVAEVGCEDLDVLGLGLDQQMQAAAPDREVCVCVSVHV